MPDSTPTLTGFEAWVYAVMGIPTAAMPNNDPGFANAFAFAMALVPTEMAAIDTSGIIYTATVYNWGGSQILQYQQDQSGQTYFSKARTAYGINNFVAGVISEASDTGTSQSMQIGKGLSNMDLLSLQRVKDPYGRQALAYMQSLGTLWGLT